MFSARAVYEASLNRVISRLASRGVHYLLKLVLLSWLQVQRLSKQARQTAVSRIHRLIHSRFQANCRSAISSLRMNSRHQQTSINSTFRRWRFLARVSLSARNSRVSFLANFSTKNVNQKIFGQWRRFVAERISAKTNLVSQVRKVGCKLLGMCMQRFRERRGDRIKNCLLLFDGLVKRRLASSFRKVFSFRRNFQVFKTLDIKWQAEKRRNFQVIRSFAERSKLCQISKNAACRALNRLLVRHAGNFFSGFRQKLEISRSIARQVVSGAVIFARLIAARKSAALKNLRESTFLQNLFDAQSNALGVVGLFHGLQRARLRLLAGALGRLARHALSEDNIELASYLSKPAAAAACQTEEDPELAAYAEIVRKLEKSLSRAETEKLELRRRLDETRDNFRLLVSRSLDLSVAAAGG